MAGLPVRGEVQDRLAVLVLEAVDRRAGGAERHVRRQLLGRVRVELGSDVAHEVGQTGTGELPARSRRREGPHVLLAEHAVLGEDELEDRVVGHARPVDQLVEHVLRHAEGQDEGEEAHGLLEVGRQAVSLGDPVQLGRSPGDVARRVGRWRSSHQRDLSHGRRI